MAEVVVDRAVAGRKCDFFHDDSVNRIICCIRLSEYLGVFIAAAGRTAECSGVDAPAEFIRENQTVDSRSQGIKNTFTGIGLFIFLWAITGEFGIGAIGLLVTFMGIGQWIIGSKQQTQDANATRMYTGNKDEKKNPNNVRTDSFEIIPSESEEKDKGVNEEKNDENK